MRRFLFWSLFPFVFPQALYIRKTAPRFPGAAGPPKGSVGLGKPVKLIAIGDSVIAGVNASNLSRALVGQTAAGLSRLLPGAVTWQAFSSIGFTSHQVTQELLPQLPAEPADFMVVSVGVNDVTSLSRSASWRRNLSALLTALQQHSPQALIAVTGIPPFEVFPLLPQPLRALFGMRGKTFDSVAREVIAGYDTALHVPVNMNPDPAKLGADGYHPSEETYTELGDLMAHHLVTRHKATGFHEAAS